MSPPGPGKPPALFTAVADVAGMQNVDARVGAVVLDDGHNSGTVGRKIVVLPKQ